MSKNKIGIVITGVLVGSSWVGAAQAAETAPRIVERIASVSAQDASDRLIVSYNNGIPQRAAGTQLLDSALRRAGLSSAASGSRAKGATISAQRLRRTALGGEVIKLSRKASHTELDALVTELKADPSVKSVEVDRLMRHSEISAPPRLIGPAAVTPNDPYYEQYQWHFKAPSVAAGGVNAPDAWELSDGAGVVVAVLDTGILRDHPDFAGTTLLEGYDFITDAEVSGRDSNNRVPGGDDLGDWDDSSDSSWHGTHVAGTVAETSQNNLGGAGLAYGATLLPVRVLGHGGGYTSDIADAIVWASGGTAYDTDGTELPTNENPAEVINLSLGGAGTCSSQPDLQEAIDTAVANGSTIVVAAGNDSSDVADYSPAGCDNVIAVGSNRITGGRAYYSNYGAGVDIAGPGGGASEDTGNDGWDGYVLQAASDAATTPESGSYNYAGYAGTSQATPHVAGTVALLQSARSAAGAAALTPAEVESLLKQSARAFPVTIPSSMPIGSGIVDAKAALDEALSGL